MKSLESYAISFAPTYLFSSFHSRSFQSHQIILLTTILFPTLVSAQFGVHSFPSHVYILRIMCDIVFCCFKGKSPISANE